MLGAVYGLLLANPLARSGWTVRDSSYRARSGHGQNLQIRSLVSDPDDRHVAHPSLDAAFRAVEPPGDDRPRQRPNGFKSVRDSVSDPYSSQVPGPLVSSLTASGARRASRRNFLFSKLSSSSL